MSKMTFCKKGKNTGRVVRVQSTMKEKKWLKRATFERRMACADHQDIIRRLQSFIYWFLFDSEGKFGGSCPRASSFRGSDNERGIKKKKQQQVVLDT